MDRRGTRSGWIERSARNTLAHAHGSVLRSMDGVDISCCGPEDRCTGKSRPKARDNSSDQLGASKRRLPEIAGPRHLARMGINKAHRGCQVQAPLGRVAATGLVRHARRTARTTPQRFTSGARICKPGPNRPSDRLLGLPLFGGYLGVTSRSREIDSSCRCDRQTQITPALAHGSAHEHEYGIRRRSVGGTGASRAWAMMCTGVSFYRPLFPKRMRAMTFLEIPFPASLTFLK